MTVADFDALHGLLQHLLPIVGDDPTMMYHLTPARCKHPARRYIFADDASQP